MEFTTAWATSSGLGIEVTVTLISGAGRVVKETEASGVLTVAFSSVTTFFFGAAAFLAGAAFFAAAFFAGAAFLAGAFFLGADMCLLPSSLASEMYFWVELTRR